ncbi:aspartyl-phosphate phosphatase Spo0E family protein [Paenibacillus psychroresistens]|uniref:Aspartyl-phosphate phosphatase Spo0E family protein n=1 Tax=Paenibacillus psychroresistens TaxID=1778678 RepID=A0A6B8RDB1_9BACL|nr:aspartyl-phosphate phosphatase Spo0E family protein [Paenibacillus psychroresistens]QGQ94199.1 aspartyl-phosphate phosphatase Spo0E family protein [Paenibacillus psychroresistens]
MDEITNILQEIERLRSKLVEYTIKAGDFIQEGVLHLSRRLDELITAYYRLITNNKKSSDLQIA